MLRYQLINRSCSVHGIVKKWLALYNVSLTCLEYYYILFLCSSYITSNFIECNNRAQKVIDASTPENLEPFKEKITTFLDCARKRLSTENENLKECREIFISTMTFYHFRAKQGNLNDVTPVEFFDLWFQFCKDFKDIWKKECAKIEKER